MFKRIKAAYQILRGKPVQKPAEERVRPVWGYEIVLKNRQTGQVLFCGVVLDYEWTCPRCLYIVPNEGDKPGKLKIELSGDEFVIIRELEDVNDFYSKELNLNSYHPSHLCKRPFW